jgi:monoterpene epsilon-lactone hydrolase
MSAGPASLPSAPLALAEEARAGARGRPGLLAPPGLGLGVPRGLLRGFMGLVGRWAFDPAVPFETQRRRLALAGRSLPRPRGLGVVREVVGGVPTERLWLTRRRAADPAATLVHFHGGGYCVGGPFVARAFVGRVLLGASRPVEALLPEYRLAPEAPFPAALEDALAVLDTVAEQGPVVVSGDSAGAGLALAATLARRDAGAPLPAAVILHCPWLDLGADLGVAGGGRRDEDPALVARDVVLSPAWLAACAEAYCGGRSPLDPAVSPLHADLRGLPPLLVQVAGDDLLHPDGRRLAVAAEQAGVPCQLSVAVGLWHDFGMQAGLLVAGTRAAEQAAAFLAGALEASGTS